MNHFYVYCIDCVSEHACYVGQTKRSIQERYEEHWYTSKRSSYAGYPLYEAFNRLGPEKFRVRCLEDCDTVEKLNIYEIYHIGKLRSSRKLYNQVGGGGYKTVFQQTKIRLFDFHTCVMVEEFDSYIDAAKALHTTPHEVIICAIDLLPIQRYFIAFQPDVYKLVCKWRSQPLTNETYWRRNYGEEAIREKQRLHIDSEAYSYQQGVLWSLTHW